MVRRNYMMTQKHINLLKKEAQKSQVSMSEVLRKAIDSYFRKEVTE